MHKKTRNERRDFIKKSGAAVAAFTILPSNVVSGFGYTAPSDKLNIAGIGVGGMGRRNLRNMNTQNIVALADVDWTYAKRCFDDYPNAKLYKDYRKMLDEMDKDIDAIMISTPDHTHYVTAADSMRAGKHVYVQKPLTHSVYESRKLREIAKETGVATQMGNQGNSSDDMRKVCEWIWNGEIGEVTKVDAWTNRPIWPQGLERPAETPSLPPTLDWDLFIGPAEWRPYHPSYTPWNWRAWWDFGTGALGDMACHIMDPVYKALELGFPYAFEASSSQVNTESAPISEKVTYYFGKRKKKGKIKMPAVEFTWYDGGLTPERPEGVKPGTYLGDNGGGAIFYGTKGTLICGTYAMNPYIIGREDNPPPVTNELRRIPDAMNGGHEMDWVRACKENKESRVECSSNFEYAGPLNETVVAGNLAVRLQGLRRRLEWDAENMKITNISDTDEIRVVTSDSFTVVDGDPRFDTKYATLNAKQAAENYIKKTYREGWSY
ncbi:Gfo/Idh/MocA family protein [Lentiprolixibacter aurantiacus]|uniref:Gfo/Idh/MocA family oxidoreductase n=1 Tax=Lentiprolixibacter aurantiacus TaxID=2993939 RepID=A0AAE3MM06_9FLAO|nr:Gfo/Idh/MocA family oxidoreductase [Lentiprolixibacter aurantiacus]MCX2719914.1 Gfo/Idh/MocA family oxidoreductase [Lentiprolixibacter aurantiacus]